MKRRGTCGSERERRAEWLRRWHARPLKERLAFRGLSGMARGMVWGEIMYLISLRRLGFGPHSFRASVIWVLMGTLGWGIYGPVAELIGEARRRKSDKAG